MLRSSKSDGSHRPAMPAHGPSIVVRSLTACLLSEVSLLRTTRRYCPAVSRLVQPSGLSTAGKVGLIYIKEAECDLVIRLKLGTAAEMANPQSLISRLLPPSRSISRQSPLSRLAAVPIFEVNC